MGSAPAAIKVRMAATSPTAAASKKGVAIV
jgi:hypothetical protein